MDCSPRDSSVQGISQARILGWVATSCSMGSSQPRDRTHVSCIAEILMHLQAGSLPLSHHGKPLSGVIFTSQPIMGKGKRRRRWTVAHSPGRGQVECVSFISRLLPRAWNKWDFLGSNYRRTTGVCAANCVGHRSNQFRGGDLVDSVCPDLSPCWKVQQKPRRECLFSGSISGHWTNSGQSLSWINGSNKIHRLSITPQDMGMQKWVRPSSCPQTFTIPCTICFILEAASSPEVSTLCHASLWVSGAVTQPEHSPWYGAGPRGAPRHKAFLVSHFFDYSKQPSFILHDLPWVARDRFKQLLMREGQGCETREKQSRGTLGQGPVTPSRDTHNNIFELFADTEGLPKRRLW